VVWIRFHAYRHLLDDFEAIPFEANDFFRIVREQSNGLQTEINQDLRAESVLTQVHWVTQLEIRIHGIEPILLKLVSLNFWREPDTPPFLAHINNDSPSRRSDLPHGLVQLRPAIAAP